MSMDAMDAKKYGWKKFKEMYEMEMNIQIQQGKDKYDDNKYEIEAEDFVRYGVTDDQDMVAYKCELHKSWHIGHSKKYEDNHAARIDVILDELNMHEDT